MEQPNLNYINDLSGDDLIFRAKLIATLKKELPEETAQYENSMKNSALKEAAGVVHKIKHKISIMGMEKSYYLAEEFENNLKNQSAVLKPEFDKILAIMQDFAAAL